MPLYTVPVTIYATAYIRADNAEKAAEQVKTLENRQIEVQGDDLISDYAFDDPNAPEISLSPSMQISDAEIRYLDVVQED